MDSDCLSVISLFFLKICKFVSLDDSSVIFSSETVSSGRSRIRKRKNLGHRSRSQNHVCRPVKDKDLKDLNFLDPKRVKEAFKDMNSYNAGGPDGMKSIVFQNLPDNMLNRISKIYQACVKLSFTPPKWCEADVIFLAKPDKPRYDVPNSFRPISKLADDIFISFCTW